MDYAEAQDRLLSALGNLNRRVVAADAFPGSLSSRRLDRRSAFGSYAVFQHLLKHRLTFASPQRVVCGLYGEEKLRKLCVLNFERFKWGGVRHDQVIYAAKDLELSLGVEPPHPTAADGGIFRARLSAVERRIVFKTARKEAEDLDVQYVDQLMPGLVDKKCGPVLERVGEKQGVYEFVSPVLRKYAWLRAL